MNVESSVFKHCISSSSPVDFTYNRTTVVEGTRYERLSRSGRANKQHATRWLDIKLFKHLWVEHGEYNHLLEGLHVLLEASNTIPSNRRVDLDGSGICAEEITPTGFVLDRLPVERLDGIENFLIAALFGMGEG